ncbi:MAG: hypothetical protein SFU98_05625 [Leptospiraceae bacterium]|nr:hypothetical protein [Leptospiraceae bacterium]
MNLVIKSLFFLILSNCCFIPEIPVKAEFHMYSINTKVDSEIARYYLDNFLQNKRVDTELDKKIQKIEIEFENQNLDRTSLKKISEISSVDFASLYFANSILLKDKNANIQRKFLENLKKVKDDTAKFEGKDYCIVFIPGFDYVENGKLTGADFAVPRKLVSEKGYPVHFIELDPIGSVEENADKISSDIKNLKYKKILLASASSAGPATYLALGKILGSEDKSRVKAWLNLGGVLKGVPVLDQFSKGAKGQFFKFIVWLKDWRMKSFESMQTEVSRNRFQESRIPPNVLVVNYFGLSLSGDISKFASDKYCLMRNDGPNDGLSLLPDLLVEEGYSILAPKSDHFFAEDPEINQKTLALLKTIVDILNSKGFEK